MGRKKLIVIKTVILCVLVIAYAIVGTFFGVFAHQGRTDGKGGHIDHDDGTYHYHHGYPAHSHYDINGDGVIDCPYKFRNNEDNKTSGDNGATTKDTNDSVDKNDYTVESVVADDYKQDGELEIRLLHIYSAVGSVFAAIYFLLMAYGRNIKKWFSFVQVITYIILFPILFSGVLLLICFINSIVSEMFDDNFWTKQIATNIFNIVMLYRIFKEIAGKKGR